MHVILNEALAFNDVILLPRYSKIESRSKIDLTSILKTPSGKEFKFYLPLISSPMDTVTGPEMCYRMWQNGGLGILHRFCTIEEQVKMVHAVRTIEVKERAAAGSVSFSVIGAAIGANGDYLDRCRALIEAGISIICIDIAHGHTAVMKDALREVRKLVGNDVHIMAGNIVTPQAAIDLTEWGADSLRVGIGSGAACSTSIQTGHGLPLLQALLDITAELEYHNVNVTLIADGGIKKGGDAVKALAAGADFCMLGSLLAGSRAAPGEVVELEDGRRMKSYRGSASASAQKDAGKTKIYEEGVSTLVKYTSKIENTLEKLENGIRSGCSYSGANNIFELQQNSIAQKITNEAYIQATPHALGNK